MGWALVGWPHGDVPSEGHQELINGSELFWCPDVQGHGAGVEILIVLLRIGEVVEALGHATVVVGVDATFLHVGEEIVDAVVMRALRSGRHGSIVDLE